jgi:hypothetical protein
MKTLQVVETVHYEFELPDEELRDEIDAARYFLNLDPVTRDMHCTHVSDRAYDIQ